MKLKSTIRPFVLAVALIGLSGCFTINLTNKNSSAKSSVPYQEWHQIGVFQLVEFSDPVDLKSRCEGKDWTTAKTELSFIQGLVRAVTWGLYSPHNVEYTCTK